MAYDDYNQNQQIAQEMQLRDQAKQEVQQASQSRHACHRGIVWWGNHFGAR